MRKICVVTGSRSEYGLLRYVMHGIADSKFLQLRIIATGMHLSPEYGKTIGSIVNDGFKVDHPIEVLLSSDSAVGITKSMGLALLGFSDALNQLEPDLVLILGDRYEALAAAVSAMFARIPVAHLHGGESTEGAFDDAIRHSITKLSNLHFVATEEYRNRVIQLGENPNTVYNVGGLGVDVIRRTRLLSKTDVESRIGFNFRKRNLLVTFHPETAQKGGAESHIDQLILALDSLEDTGIIFTMPNSDPESHIIEEKVKHFCSKNPNATSYKSLGQLLYLSCICYVDGLVGNSSSGLLEGPTLKKGTINIGERQFGRICASSVINCVPEKFEIESAIKKLYSDSFQESLHAVKNPYGDGGASEKIVSILEACEPIASKKRFYDLEC